MLYSKTCQAFTLARNKVLKYSLPVYCLLQNGSTIFGTSSSEDGAGFYLEKYMK